MNEQQLLQAYPEIFNNLSDYAVISNKGDKPLVYTIFNRTTNGYVLVEEESDKVAELMLKKGALLYDSIEEAWNPEYEPHSLKWDDNKKEWVKVYHKDL
jgi:hypothetical protein